MTVVFSENQIVISIYIIAASKAAYLTTLISHEANEIEKFNNPLQMKDWLIDKPMNGKLNKLKKSNPEAFFYWHKIYKLKILNQ